MSRATACRSTVLEMGETAMRKAWLSILFSTVAAFAIFTVADTLARPRRPAHARRAEHRPPPQPQPAPGQAQPQPPQQQPPSTSAQPQSAQPQHEPNQPANAAAAPLFALYPVRANLLETPVSRLFPGNAPPRQEMKNPVADNPEAIQRGMSYFTTFNCVGCHAPNGGGGMGPALSDSNFIYGGGAANIYLSIYQGRPNGMPSWGAMLPENIIWDLVAYIQTISKEPAKSWGKTASHDAWKIEQTPAEFSQSATPWSQTENFGAGQKPNEKHP